MTKLPSGTCHLQLSASCESRPLCHNEAAHLTASLVHAVVWLLCVCAVYAQLPLTSSNGSWRAQGALVQGIHGVAGHSGER